MRQIILWIAATGALLVGAVAESAVLPDERIDVLYHRYEGDNIAIDGPSVLVRKNVGKSVSVSASYYVDQISSASIDVVTTASPYEEEHTQTSFGVDYLRGGTMMSLGYSQSTENDYDGETWSFVVSQNLFGDLTTVTLAYGLGNNVVGRVNDDNFAEDLARQNYAIGVSQILTKNLIVGFNFEAITDEGFLNNPYRQVRYLETDGSVGRQSERYPNTRTSSAAAISGRYYLPYRAAINGQIRGFSDTWGIQALTYEVGYTHPWRDFTFSGRFRYYTQDQADFYSDLFPRFDFQNFLARDKELSTFTSTTFRLGVAYDFAKEGLGPFSRARVSAFWDHIMFDYENFRDLRVEGLAAGQEPTFQFDADVIQVLFSVWY